VRCASEYGCGQTPENNYDNCLLSHVTLKCLCKVVIQKKVVTKIKETNGRIHVCIWKRGRCKPFSLVDETLRLSTEDYPL